MLPFPRPRLGACTTHPVDGDWLAAVAAIETEPGFWWLDAALPGPRLGRYSYAGADPWLVVRASGSEVSLELRRPQLAGTRAGTQRVTGDPLEIVRALLPPPPLGEAAADLPFAGGAVGWLGYELAAHWLPVEPVARPEVDRGLPDLCLLFVDRLLAWDALERRIRAIGLGFGDDPERAARCAAERAEALAKRVAARSRAPGPPVARPSAAPATPRSRYDAESYGSQVRRAKARIAAGDAYQVCLTHDLEVPFRGDPQRLYRRLRELNPAPFGALLSLPEASILSCSPERLLHLGPDRWVESRPIKGTRPRAAEPAADRARQSELASSEKDRAENLMIVDLVRNDLGRVCETGSVHVPELMVIEPYATVFQMVSTVRGRLRPDRDVFDLLRALFPAGSMTGAPKIAAMRILAELEPVRRGVYAGAIGYLDLRGGASLSVVIRTAVLRDGRARIGVGGGIVADSDPAAEWHESWDKAAALLAAFGAAEAERS
jgi:aminodeoxychorismate synthase component I